MLKLSNDWQNRWSAADTVYMAAPASWLNEGWIKKVGIDPHVAAQFAPSLLDVKAGRKGRPMATMTGMQAPKRVVLGVLPDSVARSNSPTRRAHVYELAESAVQAGGKILVMVGVDKPDHVVAIAAAMARRVANYSMKSETVARDIELVCLDRRGKVVPYSPSAEAVGAGIEWACELVDTPTHDMTTTHFAEAIKHRFRGNKDVTLREIVGERLLKEGLRGIHGVGRAAAEEPRLTVLEYKPRGAKVTIVLVGKGVCYDTGGLSLKISGSMVSMKSDMAGAAAVVGAFEALVKNKVKAHIIVGIGMAENAIGPDAQRPDDIVRLHSGKTVEINNTDAEGRLILADALSYLCRQHKPDVAIDAATLTGAQLMATGKQIAAIFCNDDKLEKLAIEVGKHTGDLVCALPFCPEFFMDEFKSEVADMLNSVKDRMNAPSSCAAQFIHAHIEDVSMQWLHIDLAGPSFVANRATGFGVPLIHGLVSRLAEG